MDFRLLENSPDTIVEHDEFQNENDSRIKSLYDQLYLDKYTEFNPQFTVELVRLFRKTNHLKFIGSRDRAGILIGFIATMEIDNQFPIPIVGDDLSVPKPKGFMFTGCLGESKSLDENSLLYTISGVANLKNIA